MVYIYIYISQIELPQKLIVLPLPLLSIVFLSPSSCLQPSQFKTPLNPFPLPITIFFFVLFPLHPVYNPSQSYFLSLPSLLLLLGEPHIYVNMSL